MDELIVFYLLATVAAVSALAVVVQRRAVYGALTLIVCFAAIAALFIQLGAHFLGAIQIIVYAGAIMVLFLFVIMLLDPQSEDFRSRRQGLMTLAVVPSIGLIGISVYSAFKAEDVPVGQLTEAGAVPSIARALFRDYLLPFELTSVLILVAVIGAVVLVKHRG